MECEICGAEFRPSGHGRRQKYCSESCRNRSKYLRRKQRDDTPSGRDTKKATEPKPEPRPQPKPEPTHTALSARDFDRMMDDSVEDTLRHVRDRLRSALDDLSTPANALTGISRQLIEVTERLNELDATDLSGLLANDPEEVTADELGASIV